MLDSAGGMRGTGLPPRQAGEAGDGCTDQACLVGIWEVHAGAAVLVLLGKACRGCHPLWCWLAWLALWSCRALLVWRTRLSCEGRSAGNDSEPCSLTERHNQATTNVWYNLEVSRLSPVTHEGPCAVLSGWLARGGLKCTYQPSSPHGCCCAYDPHNA